MNKCIGVGLALAFLAGCSTTEDAELCKVFSPAYIDTPVADEIQHREQLTGELDDPIRQQRCH